jgi:hypothetical protein
VSSCYAEETTVVSDYSSAKLWNVIVKVNQILRLFM